MNIKQSDTYRSWLKNIKERVQSAQIKAALSANKELIHFYFELGETITVKQAEAEWGDKLIPQLSADLISEFPDIKGFSVTNLKYCKKFYEFYASELSQQFVDQTKREAISQQLVDQLPWGHNILIFTKSDNLNEARFYIHETLKNNWSRDVLALQIKSGLFSRQGKAVNNFSRTLPIAESDLALRDINKPMGISEFQLTEVLPENLKSNLPTIEEIEQSLKLDKNE